MADVRVLFVAGAADRAGQEVALLGRLRHLPEHGIDPTVAFLADGPFRGEVEAMGVPTMLLMEDAPRARELWRLPRAATALREQVVAGGYDVVEACGEKMALLVGFAVRGTDAAAVFNFQDAPLRDVPSTAVQVLGRLGRHDAVVVPSEWMAEKFRRALRYSPQVIPNAVIDDDLPEQPANIAALTGWPPGVVTIGLFGRLVAWKGAEVLVRAAAELRLGRGDLRFLLVGGPLFSNDPDFVPRVERLIDDLALGPLFHLAGHHADPRGLMAACDIVTHCSTKPEPFGVVVVEAMLLGRPVIATTEGAPGEIIDDGHDGLLTRAGDHAALAGALRRLVDAPELRARLGAAARRTAQERYTARAIAEPLAELYRHQAAFMARR